MTVANGSHLAYANPGGTRGGALAAGDEGPGRAHERRAGMWYRMQENRLN